jgi:hypothetical protein
MKGSQQVQKFNEFKKLHQTGQLRSSEIVSFGAHLNWTTFAHLNSLF